MKTRNFALCALGLAAAITFGGVETASAQARSDRRIPVRKDAPPAEVVRVDTIRMTRVDTVTMRGRSDTVTMFRYDTVTRMQVLPLQPLPGLFFGLGAGVAMPMNNWRNPSKDGPAVQAQVGYFPRDGALGIRADVGYNQISKRETGCATCPTTRVLDIGGDLLLRFPLDRTSHLNPVLTAMVGGGFDKITDFLPYRNTDGKIVTAGSETFLNYPGIPLTTATRGTKSSFFHYDAGGSLDVTAGPAHLFVEGRYLTINTVNGNSHFWPLIVGLKFY